MLFLTDSYFKHTHQKSFPNANGKIFPLAHNVNIYLHGHYHSLTISDIRKINQVDKPTAVVVAFGERAAPNIATRELPDFILIAGERLGNDAFLELTPMISYRADNASLTPGNPLTINSQNDDPQLQLPTQLTNSNGRFVLMAKLYSPHDTVCQVFYAQENQSFSESRSIKKSINKGFNYLYLPIYVKKAGPVRLRFDPGKVKGEYILFEIPESQRLFQEVGFGI